MLLNFYVIFLVIFVCFGCGVGLAGWCLSLGFCLECWCLGLGLGLESSVLVPSLVVSK